MPVLDLYGRSMDPRATFGYPSTVMPLPRGPKLFVQLPAAANRIFGTPSQKMVMEEETRVQLDPTSTFEYTQRNHGLGGLGDGMNAAKTFADKMKAKEEFKQLHPELVKTPGIVTNLMEGNKWVAGGIILVAAAGLMAFTRVFTTIFKSS
jgi:hypothetical protein